MQRSVVLVALAVVAALLVAVPAAGMAVANETAQTDANETAANETAPGEQLSGVVGVGEAELQGDIDQRAFGIQIAQAAGDGERADRVADRLVDVEDRLNNLEQRKADLDQQREAGEITEGKYRAEMARLAAETETARGLADQSNATAGQLPAELLEERGINVAAIQALQDRANELSGQEVAEIARGIAGDRVGDTPGGDRPVDTPGSDRGGQNDTADRGGDRPGGQPADDDSTDDDSTDDESGAGADDRR